MSTLRRRDVLVVHEGAERLRWDGSGDRWTLAGVWPDEGDRALLERHLAAGRPVLVVLDGGAEAVVPAWRDELGVVPEGVTVRPDEDVPGLVDLVVPALDWLPAALRERGLRFAAHAAEVERRTPRQVLPALLLEPLGDTGGVRFAWRTGVRPRMVDLATAHAPTSAALGTCSPEVALV